MKRATIVIERLGDPARIVPNYPAVGFKRGIIGTLLQEAAIVGVVRLKRFEPGDRQGLNETPPPGDACPDFRVVGSAVDENQRRARQNNL